MTGSFPTADHLRSEAADIRAHHPGIGYVATMYSGAASQLDELNAELARQQELWRTQSRVISALAAEVPDDIRARVLAPLRVATEDVETLTPDETSAAACACSLYADEFCSDDQAEATASGTFGPAERELLLSATRKLAAGGVPNFHPPGCRCGHEWCTIRREHRAWVAALAGIYEDGPSFGSRLCECGPQATPSRDCPVHWTIAILERHGFDYTRLLLALDEDRGANSPERT